MKNATFTLFSGKIIAIESVALAIVYFFLKERSWKLKDFNIGISWKLTAAGLGLLLLYYLAYYASFYIMFYPIFYLSGTSGIFNLPSLEYHISLRAILAASIVNPVFEEVIVVGYVINALSKKYGALFAVGVSLLIRLACHPYQGLFVFISILPLGILFARAYWRWRKFRPLIVAHGLQDFIAFYWYSGSNPS